MKYALLIHPKPGSHQALSPEEYGPVNAAYLALRDDPRCLGGAHLQDGDTATTVRHAPGGSLVTDGPFADTREVLGGYYVIEAEDLDDALEFTHRIPAIRLGGAVEIRPLVDVEAEDSF
ncbi:YciI family protein [Tsukamurella sp. 1534]|uniref:YciI family protein n=1 Tax=Tsukamurella sp. 1534 TaxID=1151061 RepID=UPI00030DE7AA|nr:YciI family protein [Tsukamurella sp. 1534]